MAKRKFDEVGGVVEPLPYPPVKLEFRLEVQYFSKLIAQA